jgi:hypothetical protein
MTSRTKEILSKIVLVNVDMPIWSGYKRTTEADLNKMGTKIPPGGVITKGGKQIFPREPLRDFHALKKDISRKLASFGVAVLGGSARAIPVEKMKEVEKYLELAERRHQNLMNTFENGYDSELSNHLAAITDSVVREVVTNSTLPKQDAVSRFGFAWDIFKVNPQRGKGDGLVSNLSTKLFSEVAQAASEIYTKSFEGKPRVGTRALNQIVALRDKMAGLMVLDDQSIKPVVDHMDSVLNQMPKSGWIENVNYSALLGLLSMISDPDKMLAHAGKINASNAAAAAVGYQPSTSTPAQAAVEEVKTEETPVEMPKVDIASLWDEADAPALVAEPTPEPAPLLAPVVELQRKEEVKPVVVAAVPEDKEVSEQESESVEEVLPVLPTSRLAKVANANFF